MKADKINRWLNSAKDWPEGLDLYLKYGKDEALKSIFQLTGGTAYNLGKLTAALQGMVAGRPAPAPKQPTAEHQPKTSVYSEEVKILFQKRSRLHAQLITLPNQEERKSHAFEILDISDQIDSMLDHEQARTPKKKMVDPSEIPSDRAQMVRLLNNNRAYISKFKNRPDKAEQVKIRTKQNLNIENAIFGMAHRTETS